MDNYTFFQRLALPAFLFTLFFTWCRHGNQGGILLIAGNLALCFYLCFSLKKLEFTIKKGSYVFLLIIVLFAVSSFLTGFKAFWFFNQFGIMISTISFMLYNAYDSKKWSFSKHLLTFFKLIGRCFCEIPAPFQGLVASSKVGKAKRLLQTLIALAIAIPLLAIIVALLVSADAIFSSVIDHIFGDFSVKTIFSITFTLILVFFLSFCAMKAIIQKNKETDDGISNNHKGLDPFIGILITGMVSIVYLIFSSIQIFGLFLRNLELPGDVTYADYAKEGFFQLLVVCLINLIIVLICKSIFSKNALLNTFLFVICGSTFIMLTSSAFKMYMYTMVYGLTRLRFTTFAGLGVIAVLLIGIVINVIRPDFGLYRFGVITILFGYMLLSFSHMDYWIADYNLTMEEVDTEYISSLSTDAAPAIKKHGDHNLLNAYYSHHEEINSKYYKEYYSSFYYPEKEYYWEFNYDEDELLAYKDSYRKFNLSHYYYHN